MANYLGVTAVKTCAARFEWNISKGKWPGIPTDGTRLIAILERDTRSAAADVTYLAHWQRTWNAYNRGMWDKFTLYTLPANLVDKCKDEGHVNTGNN